VIRDTRSAAPPPISNTKVDPWGTLRPTANDNTNNTKR
jgi:hypothetical protein